MLYKKEIIYEKNKMAAICLKKVISASEKVITAILKSIQTTTNGILTTEEVITTAMKVISGTTKVILATEEVTTANLKVISATTKVIVVNKNWSQPLIKLSKPVC